MSVSAPDQQTPQQPAQGFNPLQHGTPRNPTTPAATGKFPDLHSLAADIHQDLSALSAGLARAGASPEVIHSLAVMSGQIGDVTRVLGQAPPIANPAHQGQPDQAPQGPPPGASAGAPPQPEPLAQPPHAALGAATAALYHGMAAQAAAKTQQQGQ